MSLLAFLQRTLHSFALALSQIWVNKTRSVLTMIGIIIGVASVTAVIAALSGLRARVMADLEAMGASKIYLRGHWPDTGRLRYASWRTINLRGPELEALLQHCPSVTEIACVGSFRGSVRFTQEALQLRVFTCQPAWFTIENRVLTAGRPFSLTDELHRRYVCLITPATRDKLRLDRDCVGQTLFINNRGFRVIGLLEPRIAGSMRFGPDSPYEIYVPFNTGQNMDFGWVSATALARTPQLAEEAQAEIRFFLRQRRHLGAGDPDTFRMESVQQIRQAFTKVILTITLVAAGIVSISLLVGGVGIMNIMFVSVSERTREIGLRKAVGATPLAVLGQFLVEAVTLCLLGGLIGLIVGRGLTAAIASLPGARLEKAYIPLWAVATAFGFSASVGLIFGIFPALKAALLDPIEALRHE